jgi:hypothetical protein
MPAMSSTRQVKELHMIGLSMGFCGVGFLMLLFLDRKATSLQTLVFMYCISTVVAFTPSGTSPLILEVTQDTMTTIDTTELQSTSFVSFDSSDLVRYEPYLDIVNLPPK